MCQESRWSSFALAKVFFALANLRPCLHVIPLSPRRGFYFSLGKAFASAKIAFALANPKLGLFFSLALPRRGSFFALASLFASTKGSSPLLRALRLGEPESLGVGYAFLFFLPFSLLSLLSIFAKLTHMRD